MSQQFHYYEDRVSDEYTERTDALWADGYKAGFRGQPFKSIGRTQDDKMFYRYGYKQGAEVRRLAQ